MTAFHLPTRPPAGLPQAFHPSLSTKKTPIAESFPSLSVYPPLTDHRTLAELFALRYRVYCNERSFMHPRDHPNGLELDAEDARSAHFAARDDSATLIGCSRLILGDCDKAFPTQLHCVTYPGFTPPLVDRCAEVSRLAVSRQCQWGAGEHVPGSNTSHPRDCSSNGKPLKPMPGSSRQVVLDLYREMYRYSRANGIRYWYAAMEKSLWRLLARLGVIFTQIGPVQDYYGPVIPGLYDLRQLDRQLATANPALLEWFQAG